MLFNFDELVKKNKMTIRGIIHIGAHYGQEFSYYKNLGINNVICFEPVPSTFEILKKNVDDNTIIINKALGNTIGEIEMNIETSNQGMSSSILNPKIHLSQYPWITFNNKITVSIDKLDSYLSYKDDYNFINMDVQGYELEVLKGSENFLNHIDYILTEVNRDELYENCAKVDELDDFLSKYNFERVDTTWDGGNWGDALYVKKNENK